MGAFKPSFRGISDMLNSEATIGAGLLAAGHLVQAEAEATAPFDPTSNGRHFKSSFSAHLVTDHGRRGSRLAAEIYSTDPDGLHIETGTAHSPAHDTLNHALDVLGKVRR